MGAQGGARDHTTVRARGLCDGPQQNVNTTKKSPNTPPKSLVVQRSVRVHYLLYSPYNCPEYGICFHCLAQIAVDCYCILINSCCAPPWRRLHSSKVVRRLCCCPNKLSWSGMDAMRLKLL